ncbi:MAG: glycosyltransferase [Spirochaetales bacterium]|nr:glycosyltransferase [Spirochaetales bacterium]
MEAFYREMYAWHRAHLGAGFLTWAGNNQVAAALRFTEEAVWIGVFNFSETNQHARVHFDRSELPLDDEGFYRLVDPLYSSVTQSYVYYTGVELRISTINTVVSYTDRIKLLKLEKQEPTADIRRAVLRDSLFRLPELPHSSAFDSSYAFRQCVEHVKTYDDMRTFLVNDVLTQLAPGTDLQGVVALGLKRAFYYLQRNHQAEPPDILDFIGQLAEEDEIHLSSLGSILREHNKRGPCVFISAEAEPFSKSGGLANVVFELPRELASLGEDVYVITPRYRSGTDYSMQKMQASSEKYNCVYTGETVSFYIEETKYDVGVHTCKVEGMTYYLLDHHEFFDGLYWGYSSGERLRKRIALARASAEVILHFHLEPQFVLTNDAFAGVFNGIVRSDPYYAHHPDLQKTSLFHVIHNGGWQYFDAYGRYEQGKDLFSLFNLDFSHAGEFTDPVNENTLNCMATGIRFADKSITVSPSYAEQLRVASDGLERVIGDVVGISNAIGTDFADKAIQHLRNYKPADQLYKSLLEKIQENEELSRRLEEQSPELLAGLWSCDKVTNKKRREILQRTRNKLLLQAEYGLEIDPDKKLAVMVHRVADQKGYQLLLEASEGIIQRLDYQVIAGGPVINGDQQSEDLGRGLADMAEFYPGKVSVKLGFLDVRMLLLGSDVFLMPSRHEPGGISQIEALACGCLVIARATGGLRDSIRPIQVRGSQITGNGILFTDYSSGAFYDAMRRFAGFINNADENMRYRARENARNSAAYWDTPARQYLDIMYDHKEIIRP